MKNMEKRSRGDGTSYWRPKPLPSEADDHAVCWEHIKLAELAGYRLDDGDNGNMHFRFGDGSCLTSSPRGELLAWD